MTDSPISIENSKIEARVGHTDFYSATYRLFKLDAWNRTARTMASGDLQGDRDNQPHSFELDGHHVIETGKIFPYVEHVENVA